MAEEIDTLIPHDEAVAPASNCSPRLGELWWMGSFKDRHGKPYQKPMAVLITKHHRAGDPCIGGGVRDMDSWVVWCVGCDTAQSAAITYGRDFFICPVVLPPPPVNDQVEARD